MIGLFSIPILAQASCVGGCSDGNYCAWHIASRLNTLENGTCIPNEYGIRSATRRTPPTLTPLLVGPTIPTVMPIITLTCPTTYTLTTAGTCSLTPPAQPDPCPGTITPSTNTPPRRRPPDTTSQRVGTTTNPLLRSSAISTLWDFIINRK